MGKVKNIIIRFRKNGITYQRLVRLRKINRKPGRYKRCRFFSVIGGNSAIHCQRRGILISYRKLDWREVEELLRRFVKWYGGEPHTLEIYNNGRRLVFVLASKYNKFNIPH